MATHIFSNRIFSDRILILRIRSFSVVALGALWVGLLSLDAYLRGGYRTPQEWATITILLVVNAISSVAVPTFVLLDSSDSSEGSRWFSHVRFEFVFLCTNLVLQTTAALLFTILCPSFRCDDPNGNADLEGVCRLIDVYISIASWLTPMILLSFTAYLALVCFQPAKHFPALWRTSVRFWPFDDRRMSSDSKTVESNRPIITQSGLRELEDGSRTASSTASSSRILSQESPHSAPLSFSRFQVAPGRGSPRTVSQVQPLSVTTPFPVYRPISQPPPCRRGSRPAPNEILFSSMSAQRPLDIPPRLVPSRPLPLRPVAGSQPGRSLTQMSNASSLPFGRIHPSGLKGSNHVRRDMTMYPLWLGKR